MKTDIYQITYCDYGPELLDFHTEALNNTDAEEKFWAWAKTQKTENKRSSLHLNCEIVHITKLIKPAPSSNK